MNKRKKVPLADEADVLVRSGRRCCICYALKGNFQEKKGQIAHLDHNPENVLVDNLCFLCLDHHNEYDSQRRQSKGFTLKEVKQYRSDLYKTFSEWKARIKAIDNFPIRSQVPLLNFFEDTSSVIKTTTQGLKIVEQQAGFRAADKKRLASLNWDVQFQEILVDLRWARVLHLKVSMPFGLSMLADVCAYNNWSITGFMNVLRNNLDIWMLHGQLLKNDERESVFQPSDSLLIYRTSDGENRMIVSTHSVSESLIQVHARLSDKVVYGLANHLDTIGFSKPFKD